MKGPKIRITTSCMDCSHVKSREPAVDDLFRCDLLSSRFHISPDKETPIKCPLLRGRLDTVLKRFAVRLVRHQFDP
jgi:hypothetical protein